MADLELSVTICSWNTLRDLRACLASLRDIKDEAAFEVIVVDNNSEDESAQMVADEFPEVRLFPQARNLGFTGGHNFAMKQKKAPHTLLLNSDTIVHAGAFRKLLDALKERPDVGIIGPKLLNTDGSLQLSCRRFPNPVAALFRNTLLGKLWPKNPFTRKYLMSDFDHSKPFEPEWVSGAAFIITEACFNKIGPMDEGYFMFCEDVDWCWRCWEGGFKVLYYPDAVITHAIGKSTDKAPNRMIGRFHKSMFRFYRLNMAPKITPIFRPFAIGFAAVMLGMRGGIFIVKNRLDDIKRAKNAPPHEA